MKNLNILVKSATKELGEFSAKRYALFGATLTGLIFEWSPANEAILGKVGVSMHEKIGTGASIIESLLGRLATGAVTGGVSFTEQVIVGSLTALSLHQFPDTFKKWQDTRPDNALKSISSTSNAVTALGLGSSMAVIEKNIIEKNSDIKDSLRVAVRTSGIVGGSNFILAGVVSGALNILEKNGQETTSQNIENIVKNPFLYIGLFGLAKTLSVIKDKKNHQKSSK